MTKSKLKLHPKASVDLDKIPTYHWPDGGNHLDPQAGAKEFHEAMKQDTEKPKMSLISPWVLEELAKVLTEGAKKYAPDNWRNSNGFTYRRLIDAALRHINSFNKGEDLDPEWGISHLAHAIACLMFLEEQRKLGRGTDDRWKP